MRDEITTPGGRPTLTWVPVVDTRGRTHMEACWSATAAAAAAPSASVAHHAA